MFKENAFFLLKCIHRLTQKNESKEVQGGCSLAANQPGTEHSGMLQNVSARAVLQGGGRDLAGPPSKPDQTGSAAPSRYLFLRIAFVVHNPQTSLAPALTLILF